MSSSEEKTKIVVDIYGSQYKLVASTSPGYMKKVAEYVDEQMFRIAKGYPRLDSQRIAVLAAVNMADECFRMQAAIDALQTEQKQQETAKANHQSLLNAYTELKETFEAKLKLIEQQRQSELAELTHNHALEKQRQQEQFNREKEELMQRSLRDEELHLELERVKEEHKELREEYAKLQSEYNEWIQLVEEDGPDR